MKISYRLGDVAHVEVIEIHLTVADDPEGHITGMVLLGRLEAFLRALGRPGDYGAPKSAAEAAEALAAFTFVTQLAESRLEGMMLAARDRWQMGWGAIAAAAGMSRSSARDKVLSARGRYAEAGAWYDAAGFHRATREAALSALLAPGDGEAPSGSEDAQ